MVCLCYRVVTVFEVMGKSVCRGHKGFQAQRQVADQNTCVGSRAVLGGTFARFVLDEAVGSCSHQYYWLKHLQLLRFLQLMKGQSSTWLIIPRLCYPICIHSPRGMALLHRAFFCPAATGCYTAGSLAGSCLSKHRCRQLWGKAKISSLQLSESTMTRIDVHSRVFAACWLSGEWARLHQLSFLHPGQCGFVFKFKSPSLLHSQGMQCPADSLLQWMWVTELFAIYISRIREILWFQVRGADGWQK